MFRYMRNIEGNSNPVMMWVKATATAENQPAAGDAVAISSGLAVKASASSTLILGIAKEDTIDDNSNPLDQHVLVIVDPQATFEVGYTGTTKTTLADTDLFAYFDLSDEATLDLDASTKDHFTVLEYDNDNDKAIVKNNVPIV